MSQCLRCGHCCKSYLCFVPKYEISNLSPDFLETVNEDSLEDYINENIEEQGSICKWLTVDERGLHSCSAYERRSSMCRDHNSLSKICRIGQAYWEDKENIPCEIKNILSLNKKGYDLNDIS